MRATVEKLDNNMVKLEVEVESLEFEKTLQQVYNKNRVHFAIPGFRKGKAPRKVIERFAGEGVFYEDAFREIFPSAYRKALVTYNIEPADQPDDIEIVNIGEGQNLLFTVKVQLEPVPEVGQYKGIEIEKVSDEVTENDVDDELKKLQQKQTRWLTVEDEGAKDGNGVIISCAASLEDQEIESLTSQRKMLMLGNDQFVPGLDSQLIDMKQGEHKEFELLMPDNFEDEALRAQTLSFSVVMLEIKTKEMPEIDDEFAKDVSEFDSLQDLKEDLRVKKQKELKVQAKNQMVAQLITKICENSSVDIPESMVERSVENMLEHAEEDAKKHFGRGLADLEKYNLINLETIKANYKEQAQAEIKEKLVLKQIAAIEGVIADTSEVQNALPKDFRSDWENLTAEDDADYEYIKSLKEILAIRKTIDILFESAVVIEKVTQENETQETLEEADEK